MHHKTRKHTRGIKHSYRCVAFTKGVGCNVFRERHKNNTRSLYFSGLMLHPALSWHLVVAYIKWSHVSNFYNGWSFMWKYDEYGALYTPENTQDTKRRQTGYVDCNPGGDHVGSQWKHAFWWTWHWICTKNKRRDCDSWPKHIKREANYYRVRTGSLALLCWHKSSSNDTASTRGHFCLGWLLRSAIESMLWAFRRWHRESTVYFGQNSSLWFRHSNAVVDSVKGIKFQTNTTVYDIWTQTPFHGASYESWAWFDCNTYLLSPLPCIIYKGKCL